MSNSIIVNTHQDFCTQIRATSQTTQAKFGLSWQETATLLNRHTLNVQSWLSSRSPQGKRFEGLGVTATSTGIQYNFLNLALGAHFPPESSGEVIEQEIERVQAFFSERNVPFMWLVSPFASPPDMNQRLHQHKLKPREYNLPALVAPLSSSDGWPELNPKIEVWQVKDKSDLEAASTIRHVALRSEAGIAETYFEDMADDWLSREPARLYMARVGKEGPPAAIGALILDEDGQPGVYIMATLPQWQGNGLGKAILTRILSQAKSEGHKRIFLTSGARAYSLYRKFGFEHIFEYTMFVPAEQQELK